MIRLGGRYGKYIQTFVPERRITWIFGLIYEDNLKMDFDIEDWTILPQDKGKK